MQVSLCSYSPSSFLPFPVAACLPPGRAFRHREAVTNATQLSYRPTGVWPTRLLLFLMSEGNWLSRPPQYNTPIRKNQPASALDLRKTEESRCFECHNAPTPAHKERWVNFTMGNKNIDNNFLLSIVYRCYTALLYRVN